MFAGNLCAKADSFEKGYSPVQSTFLKFMSIKGK